MKKATKTNRKEKMIRLAVVGLVWAFAITLYCLPWTRTEAAAAAPRPIEQFNRRPVPNYDLNAARNLQNMRQATGAQLAAVQTLKTASSAQNMQVRWNTFGGSPDVMYDFASPAYPGTPEEAGRAFLTQNAAAFGIANINNLRLFSQTQALGGTLLRFQQTFGGIDVKDGGVGLVLNASNQVIIRALAQMAKVNVVFDPAFRPSPISIEIRNQTFAEALQSITGSTQTFYRVTAPRTITIIPDTPAKRREYEEDIVRTFYLSNADLKETMDLLRIVIDARRIGAIQGTNAITITDTAERIEAAGRLISMIDKARPEVMTDVELLEVNRARFTEYGLQFASPNSAGPNGIADVNRTGLTFNDLKNLTGSQILMTQVPGVYYRLLKQDRTTRVLANPQLRSQVGYSAQAEFGDRVPVPVTTFSPIATGGVNQQPITSYNYENIGVNIDITPRTHMNNEVTLALAIRVTSISGTGFGGLPTFGNRLIKTTIRLKDGETNMLAGLIRDDERKVRDGIPGLSDIPGIGHLLGQSSTDRNQTDVIVMLTPRIVRVLELTEEDLRGFQMGRDTGTTGAIPGGRLGGPGVGIPLPLPDQPPAPDPDAAVPSPGAPVQPVLPPAPAPQTPPGRGQTPPR